MNLVLSRRPWLLLLAAYAGIAAPIACAPGAPDESNATGTFSTSTGSGGATTSASSTGVGIGTGGTCSDPKDPDGDFAANSLEGAPMLDTDGDGMPDYMDTDSDNDTWPDKLEAVNPLLNVGVPGQARSTTCDALADTDGDGIPDLRDPDSDNDGVSDLDEKAYDPDGSKNCRVLVDCDNDGIVDVVEIAAGSDPADPKSMPADSDLYFLLPYDSGDKTKDFTFSTGIAKADIYFMVDTTSSMQPSIQNLVSSLDTAIIPKILNGDLTASPPIPAITDANIGIGTFRDVPWDPYGEIGDDIYRNTFSVNSQTVLGNVAPPIKTGGTYSAPASVETILGSLQAAGGGDNPEGTLQALWIASTNQLYSATVGTNGDGSQPWVPVGYPDSYPIKCSDPGMFGVPCFRPQSLPIFVLVSDAPMHNGPFASDTPYDPGIVGGTAGTGTAPVTYAQTVAAINAINARVIGVPVNTGSAGLARADFTDLATKTGSVYFDAAFGGTTKPLVPSADVQTGDVSTEVVQLIGELAGAGLHDVTTARANYSCAGGVDCNGDGVVDPAYKNPPVDPQTSPFDASTLITSINTVASTATPLPYGSLDATTFHAVRGAAEVTFRVHANNTTVKPDKLVVVRAIIHVETPTGQLLGGKNGVKLVYFVIPQYFASLH